MQSKAQIDQVLRQGIEQLVSADEALATYRERRAASGGALRIRWRE